MTIARRSILAAGIAAAALTMSACGGGSGATAGSGAGSAAAGETKAVSLMLNWYPYGEHAPFYYGVEQGIFKKHGIDLTIKAGQGSTKTVQATGQGQVDFGWADTPAVLANVDKGVKVKSLGVYLQTTPSAVQVFSDSGIKTPADLKGKTIAVSAGDAPTVTFPIFLKAAGLSPDDVKQQNLDAAGKIAAVMSNKVDGLIGFAHDQGPTIANKSGKQMSYLRYADAGLNFYSNGLISSDSYLSKNKDVATRMMAALSESFEAAVQNPEAAAKSMDGKDPQIPPAPVVLDQWKETIKLLHTSATQGKKPGVNDAADWTATIDTLKGAGLLESGGDAAKYYDSQYQPK
ncbi:NitT/TauT family transport system substrate-binding protein [Pseudarthrobacter defluvii]|uniref:ABC transporter substrate-binding protein n=1 Tax=Pseudarthrobacter defluvii TaxID=410837 RepID=UPI00278ADA9B|nr:ABC transporter substrate-binding protein [Pseudarthrobacter defluvii]MDQ0768060.1 NitT/TauT family transport system substrate-binding protein [Pseudarthrobacter defluvii]